MSIRLSKNIPVLASIIMALLFTACGKEITLRPTDGENVKGAVSEYFNVENQEYIYHSSGDNGKMEIELSCRSMMPGELMFSFGIAVYDRDGKEVASADDVLPEATLRAVANMSQGETSKIELQNLPSLSDYNDADSLTFCLTSRLTTRHALEDGNYTLDGEIDEGCARHITISLTVDGLKVYGEFAKGKGLHSQDEDLTGSYIPADEKLAIIDSIGGFEVGVFSGIIENDTLFVGKYIDRQTEMASAFRFVITKGGNTVVKKLKAAEDGDATAVKSGKRSKAAKKEDASEAPKSDAAAAEAAKPAAPSASASGSGTEGMSKAEKAAAKRKAEAAKPKASDSE